MQPPELPELPKLEPGTKYAIVIRAWSTDNIRCEAVYRGEVDEDTRLFRGPDGADMYVPRRDLLSYIPSK